ncbi:MAG: Na+/H+ antiporter NhaA [Alphaproteobacteria bacterium]|nr:Na+/H+ antiporter NhaA [Alphaproteobacteria bacterium]
MITRYLRNFLELEAAGGIVLMLSAALALLLANSPYAAGYQALLVLPLTLEMGGWHGSIPVQGFIADMLMVLFFLQVGLEIKREMADGELSGKGSRLLPMMAALGGMVLPAAIYVAFTHADAEALRGWAIPSATDIAFALGVLMLFGKRVPVSLKVFLTAVAVIDDLGAIVIIALFYTKSLALGYLGMAAVAWGGLLLMERLGVSRLLPYLIVGIFIWWAIHHAGVHATIAGVMVGLAIPLSVKDDESRTRSPLKKLEHFLHPIVTYVIMPLFAFATAGLSLAGLSLEKLADPVPLGITLGLFLGKQWGLFLAVFACIRMGWAKLPEGAGWGQLYAVCMFAGIGFTMSLFISMLAFGGNQTLLDEAKLGIFLGSLLSALAGAAMLAVTCRRAPASTAQ